MYIVLFNEEDIPRGIVRKYAERYHISIVEEKKIDEKNMQVVLKPRAGNPSMDEGE